MATKNVLLVSCLSASVCPVLVNASRVWGVRLVMGGSCGVQRVQGLTPVMLGGVESAFRGGLVTIQSCLVVRMVLDMCIDF